MESYRGFVLDEIELPDRCYRGRLCIDSVGRPRIWLSVAIIVDVDHEKMDIL